MELMRDKELKEKDARHGNLGIGNLLYYYIIF